MLRLCMHSDPRLSLCTRNDRNEISLSSDRGMKGLSERRLPRIPQHLFTGHAPHAEYHDFTTGDGAVD